MNTLKLTDKQLQYLLALVDCELALESESQHLPTMSADDDAADVLAVLVLSSEGL